jgi:pimeloyl-ACP methyl ester carboxylesterase
MAKLSAEADENMLEVHPGTRLHFAVWQGEGPVVLLEAGGGVDLTQWGSIPQAIRSRSGATVISYSRAGFGSSDLPDTAYDMREEIGWLMVGLRQLELDRGLILIGHSYGGWLIRLFAHEYPDRVRGLVFVDPFSHELVDRVGVEMIDQMTNAGSSEAIPEHDRTNAQHADIRMMRGGVGPKAELMRETEFPQTIPYRVITCGLTDWLGPAGPTWRSVHEAIAGYTALGKLLIAEGARHMIPAEAPQVVVDAVLAVMNEAQGI